MIDTKSVIKIDEKSFDQIAGTGVALVDFWAEWCMPCRMQGPILDKVAPRVGDRAKVAKLNVDNSPSVAEKYGITSIPTLILFKEGKVFQQFVGVQSEATLVSAIEKALE